VAKVLIALFAVFAVQAPAVDPVLARLDAYLAAYEPRLSELIADEVMTQSAPNSSLADLLDDVGRPARQRRLESEVAFIALPNQAGWLGFRHVKSVNNRSVDQREDALSTALRSSVISDAARRLLEDSARYNMGLPRTTNLPNLPLEFIHPSNRRRFVVRADGTERIRGVATTRVVMIERRTPTLIRHPDGSEMWSAVKAWIDPVNGRLLRAEVRSEDRFSKKTTNSIRVEFVYNAQFDLLVPAEMEETFPVDAENRGAGVARYSNYRRFQTSARIVPQPAAGNTR
jgi:hypothetical protein